MNTESLSPLLQTLIPILTGCIFIFFYLRLQKKKTKLKDIGETAEGIVFAINHKAGATDSGNTPYPVIRFVTRKGEWMTEQSNVSSLFVQKGKKVKVMYNPDNPKEFTSDLGMPSNIILPSFLVIGLALIAFGIYNSYASKIFELLNT